MVVEEVVVVDYYGRVEGWFFFGCYCEGCVCGGGIGLVWV